MLVVLYRKKANNIFPGRKKGGTQLSEIKSNSLCWPKAAACKGKCLCGAKKDQLPKLYDTEKTSMLTAECIVVY